MLSLYLSRLFRSMSVFSCVSEYLATTSLNLHFNFDPFAEEVTQFLHTLLFAKGQCHLKSAARLMFVLFSRLTMNEEHKFPVSGNKMLEMAAG